MVIADVIGMMLLRRGPMFKWWPRREDVLSSPHEMHKKISEGKIDSEKIGIFYEIKNNAEKTGMDVRL